MKKKSQERKRELGKLLEVLRLRLSQREHERSRQVVCGMLASKHGIGVSPQLLHKYESGESVPPKDKLDALLRILSATPAEMERAWALWRESDSRTWADLRQELDRVMDEGNHRHDTLLRLLWEDYDDWASTASRVTWSLIPVAGWQAGVLSADVLRRMVQRAVDEAKLAKIQQHVVVVRPHQHNALQEVEGLILVDQEGGDGIGHAIRSGLTMVPRHEPVALILADEAVHVACLNAMQRLYTTHMASVIGLMPEEKDDREHFGMARVDGADPPRIKDIVEKPDASKKIQSAATAAAGYMLRVLGRMILSVDLASRFRRGGHGRMSPLRADLSAVLTSYAKQMPLYGYVYEGDVKNVVAVQRAFASQIDKVVSFPKDANSHGRKKKKQKKAPDDREQTMGD